MSFLTEKHGPLPTWAWGGLGVGAVLVGLYMRKRSGVSVTPATTPSGTGEDTGTTVGPATTSSGTTPDTVDNLNALNDALSALPTQIGATVGDELASYFGQPSVWDSTAGDGAKNIQIAQGDPAGVGGFWWGGEWMTSLPQFQAWRKRHGLANNTLAQWAYDHPSAARTIGLVPPSHMPSPNPNKAGGRVPTPSVHPRIKIPIPRQPASIHYRSDISTIMKRFHSVAVPVRTSQAVHRAASKAPAAHRH